MFKASKDFKSSSTKTIFFVRHGESIGNVGPISQTAEASLTDVGHRQAKQITERCAKLPVEIIISSTMNRARETSEHILTKLKKPIEYSDFFVERRRPSEQYGKPKNTPEWLDVEKKVIENFAKPDFRFSNEENFNDLKKRAQDALAYLAKRPEEKMLVVTHGFFMRVLASYAILQDALTGKGCEAFIRSLPLENTGVTVFLYNESDKQHPWAIWTWNDHTHLAE